MIITDILTEYGSYYLGNRANRNNLRQLLRYGAQTEQMAQPMIIEGTRYEAAKSTHTRVLQPFQKAWTPIGEVTFTPRPIDTYRFKVDVEEDPDDLEASWLGFLAGMGELDRKKWPFVRWLMEQHIIPQSLEDRELNEVYGGVYAAPTPGTAGGSGTAMDGIKKIINDFITAGDTSTIATGALSATPATLVGQFEGFVDAINKKYWMIPMQLGVNQEVHRRFMRGYEELYGQYTNYQDNPAARVKFSNITLIPLPSLGSSEKIFCTPKNNFVKLMQRGSNDTLLRVENVDRKVKIYGDFRMGLGFIIPEIIFTNDRDLV